MEKRIDRARVRARKKKRIRKHLQVRENYPRLCVFKSGKHMYAHIVDDFKGMVIASASTLSKDLKGELKDTNKTKSAEKVGELIAKYAKKHKVEKVTFDRSGYIYHGRVKALAEAARKGGLKF